MLVYVQNKKKEWASVSKRGSPNQNRQIKGKRGVHASFSHGHRLFDRENRPKTRLIHLLLGFVLVYSEQGFMFWWAAPFIFFASFVLLELFERLHAWPPDANSDSLSQRLFKRWQKKVAISSYASVFVL